MKISNPHYPVFRAIELIPHAGMRGHIISKLNDDEFRTFFRYWKKLIRGERIKGFKFSEKMYRLLASKLAPDRPILLKLADPNVSVTVKRRILSKDKASKKKSKKKGQKGGFIFTAIGTLIGSLVPLIVDLVSK